jgi:hypothetical protein
MTTLLHNKEAVTHHSKALLNKGHSKDSRTHTSSRRMTNHHQICTRNNHLNKDLDTRPHSRDMHRRGHLRLHLVTRQHKATCHIVLEDRRLAHRQWVLMMQLGSTDRIGPG